MTDTQLREEIRALLRRIEEHEKRIEEHERKAGLQFDDLSKRDYERKSQLIELTSAMNQVVTRLNETRNMEAKISGIDATLREFKEFMLRDITEIKQNFKASEKDRS